MKIIKIKDHLFIKELHKRITEYTIREKTELPAGIMIKWLRSNLNNQFVGYWVAQDDESKIVGYCVCAIHALITKEVLEIVILDADTEEIENKLYETIEKFAIDYGIKYIGASSSDQNRWVKYGLEVNEHKFLKEI